MAEVVGDRPGQARPGPWLSQAAGKLPLPWFKFTSFAKTNGKKYSCLSAFSRK